MLIHKNSEALIRGQYARDAFYGCNPALFAHLCGLKSYEMDGVRHPANGLGLHECIALVNGMSTEELEVFAAE